MTSYEPPTEDLAIFDPSVFSINDEPLTYAQAVKKFLKYPIAQGTETIESLNTGGVLEIRSNGTTGVKILNNQTGSAAQPPITGRTDFFNENTSGVEVNSAMIDYSGIHTGTLNTLDSVSGALNICPNIARAAPINIATGTNATSGCIVNIGNGNFSQSIIRMGKNNLFDLDSTNGALSLSNIGLNSGAINIGSGTNSQGTISIGNGDTTGSSAEKRNISIGAGLMNGSPAQTRTITIGPQSVSGAHTGIVNIGKGPAIAVSSTAAATSNTAITGGQVDLIGTIRLNATGSLTNTITMSSQGSATGFIEMANGNSSSQAFTIGGGNPYTGTLSLASGGSFGGVLNLGNANAGAGTINLGANGGTGLIQIGSTGRAIDFRGTTVSMFPTTFQVTGTNFSVGSGTTTLFNGGGVTIGNSAQATSLLTIAQNTAGLVAGNLGFTTNIGPTVFTFVTKSSSAFVQATTISAPAYQVSLISITCNFTSVESVNIFRYGASLSATTASSTEVRAGFSFYEEADITPTTANTFSTISLSGVYTNTTASAVTLYLNTALQQTWVTTAPTLTYTISITKIA